MSDQGRRRGQAHSRVRNVLTGAGVAILSVLIDRLFGQLGLLVDRPFLGKLASAVFFGFAWYALLELYRDGDRS
jgi:hypothetical protein